jgi:hypothetical protein
MKNADSNNFKSFLAQNESIFDGGVSLAIAG